MNPDIIQFQCSACQSVLTVPAHLAGVSGPCPTCGHTVTSPTAPPSYAAQTFAAPSFGGMQAGLNAQQPQEALPTYSLPAQPMPGAVSGPTQQPMNTGLLGGSAFPSAHQAPAAPTWQQPGLGQTLMPAGSPTPGGFMQPSMGQPSFSGNLLPPQRTEGQMPMSGGQPQLSVNPTSWGSGLSPQLPSEIPQDPLGLPQRNQAPSSLIPGSVVPMMNGFSDQSDRGSLLGQALPSSPLSSVSAQASMESNGQSVNIPAPSGGYSRALKKPKRSSNVFMVGLAVLLLGGFLVLASWLFREPIMQLVGKFTQQQTSSVIVDATAKSESGLPSPTPKIEVIPTVTQMAESVPQAETQSFNPSETVLASLKAEPATSEEIAQATKSAAAPAMAETNASALQNPAQSGTLVEVPATGTGSLKQASADSSTRLASDRGEIKLDVPPEVKPAADALQKFLAAQNLEERLKYTLAVESMKPLMERYYKDNPSGPILVDAIGLVRYDPKPQVGAGAHALFGVESKTWEFPLIVMLEERDGTFKVDWLSFVESKDRLLEKYIHTYQEGQVRYHVSMTRTHYFEDKVPNSSNKEAFRISPAPPNPFTATVFVDKDSVLSRELRDKIPWGAQVFVIVELEWMKLGNQAWVQMTAVPQLNWYSVPSAPKAYKAGSSINPGDEVPSEKQKAVPIGR